MTKIRTLLGIYNRKVQPKTHYFYLAVAFDILLCHNILDSGHCLVDVAVTFNCLARREYRARTGVTALTYHVVLQINDIKIECEEV